jgi:hypothetical protein
MYVKMYFSLHCNDVSMNEVGIERHTNLDTERVEAGSISGMEGLALNVVLPPAIVVSVRAKVKRARRDVVSTLLVGVVVAA